MSASSRVLRADSATHEMHLALKPWSCVFDVVHPQPSQKQPWSATPTGVAAASSLRPTWFAWVWCLPQHEHLSIVRGAFRKIHFDFWPTCFSKACCSKWWYIRYIGTSIGKCCKQAWGIYFHRPPQAPVSHRKEEMPWKTCGSTAHFCKTTLCNCAKCPENL